MANINNVYASIVAFIVASAMTWGFWVVVNDFLMLMPIGLRVFCGTAWFTLIFFIIFINPIEMGISDDSGR